MYIQATLTNNKYTVEEFSFVMCLLNYPFHLSLHIFFYTYYKTKSSAASVCLSLCLLTKNSKTTAPIDRVDSSGKYWYIVC